ncbi:hypothetical protein STEG23_014127, partial [Scotinomys teguina]
LFRAKSRHQTILSVNIVCMYLYNCGSQPLLPPGSVLFDFRSRLPLIMNSNVEVSQGKTMTCSQHHLKQRFST